jgi:nucleoside-diphosphate-sugar epimerase
LRILITGATGLLGAELMDRLGEQDGAELVAVSRRGAPNVASWDMARDPPPAAITGRFDAIIHTAADTRWTMGLTEAIEANVATVQALAPLVASDTHVIHVSTAYALGRGGDGSSSDPNAYRNSYEWSKAQAERIALGLAERVSIVRPPLIIGRRSDGRAARFAGMYTILRGIASSVVPVVVAVPDAYFDVVPVDDVAEEVMAALHDRDSGVVHTIAGGKTARPVAHCVEVITGALNAWRRERGLTAFDLPRLVSPDSWQRFYLPLAREHLSPRQEQILDLLSHFHPYLAVQTPLEPTHVIDCDDDCLAASVRYWADTHQRLAAQQPRSWQGLRQTTRPPAT